VAAVTLTIVQPAAEETVLRGTEADNVALAGQIGGPLPDALEGVPLFYRWYSSLFRAATDRYSLNEPALTSPSQPFVTALRVGTHVITFAASDQTEETELAQENTRHGGVTGGAQGAGRRLVHVLGANPVVPPPGGPTPTLRKAGARLEAEAPLHWGRRLGQSDGFEPNPEYHGRNRIRYRWRFTPRGAPAGRRAADLVPALQQLRFDPTPPSGFVPVVRYDGALPSELDTGDYTLTLRVEDATDETVAHERSRNIVLTA
jgi:hypothetical protein